MTNDVDPDLLTTANIETFRTVAFYAQAFPAPLCVKDRRGWG